ncbi:MAG: YncE family protein [Polyangiaceae bacterium]
MGSSSWWLRAACSAAALAAAVAAASCGSSSGAANFGAGTGGGSSPGPSGSSSGGSGSSSGALAGDDGGGPPEAKNEGNYRSPVATGQYVWITNPTSGRVAYIQASTLQVATVAAGNGPTYLAAVPGSADAAIVLNVLSSDATLLTASNGSLTTRTFPVAGDANAWAVSGDGHWAIAWASSSQVKNPDPTQGFQDVSALDLTGQKPPTILAVGYRPVTMAFASDGSRAFAVTQDGVSVIDLTGSAPLVTANFPVSTDPNDDPGTRDVSITPDGAYALVRRDGQAAITVVALSDGTLTTVTLPADATDLTLTPAGDAALVVMRDIATVAVLPLPQIATSPATFTLIPIAGQTVGRAIVAADGKTTLLFTTVLPVDLLTVLDLPTQAFRTVKLYAPLGAVFPTLDAKNAVVLHTQASDAGIGSKGAFSVVPVAAQLPAKIVGTDAPPNAVALSPAGDRALVTARDDAGQVYEAFLAKMPSLEVDKYTLASPPIAAGVVAGANRAYVAQSNPEGRITFIDLGTGQARTLTGFELGSRVVDGSQP